VGARTAIGVVIAAALLCGIATAQPPGLTADVGGRRARLMNRLGPDTLFIAWSAPPRRYSLDIDYEYRQDSNLYYLTGLTEQDATLVLMPGNGSHREVLFVKDQRPAEEHWTGRVLSHGEAAARTGIETVLSTAQFDGFIAAMLSRQGFGPIDAKDASPFFSALAAGRGRVALVLEPDQSVSGTLSPPLEFSRRIRDRFVGFDVVDAQPILADLRTIKTPYEREVLAKSVGISNDAQMAGMRAARPGAYEYQVKAAVEAVHRARGAVSWAYPSIVASGPNATILHYPDSDRQMQAGELLLVDAACNFQYLSGDITRTYPVSGTFSDAQRELYEIVLAAQEAGIREAHAGSSLAAIHRKTVEVMKSGLLRVGLITNPDSDQYRLWYTHGATHYLGVDVHDVGDRNRPLELGMAFTIEPGVYIRASALEALPRSPANDAFIAEIQPALRKYTDIGIRIEDSFLLDASGLRRLSAAVPRTIDEIEQFMRSRPAPAGSASR
jgi:Xaa-Pro aminopeptidase